MHTQRRGIEVRASEWSDAELAAAVVDRRRDGFDELYRRHAGMVTAAARTTLGRSNHADDVAADVLLDFWRRPERFDAARGSLAGFLRTQARSRSIDFLRAEGARARRETRQRVGTCAAATPEEQAVDADSAATVRKAVAQLPDCERVAVSLAYFQGMTYREAANYLGQPEGTIKSRIRNGLKKLKAAVADFDAPAAAPTDAMAG